ncbi:hypothetical protein AnigIFM56816_005967 [Aspergillus niger]|nr:hypothetical protein AnigIFM56816_005967 [Aspergillus niger]
MLCFDENFLGYTPTIHHDTYAPISTSHHEGQAVLISGASRGIGRAIATSFAKSGATAIAIISRSDLDETEAEMLEVARDAGLDKPNILKLQLDITDEDAIKKAAKKVKLCFGRLDILVNNAGRLDALCPILGSDTQEWWKTLEVNLKGTYLVTKYFLNLLLQGEQKTIVITSSIGAISEVHGMSSYQISKTALLRLSDFLMHEVGNQGILAFCIHPGIVMTRLVDVIPESERGDIFVDHPRLCGDTVAWLTQERRDWLAGRLISVSWDMLELNARREEIIRGDKLKLKFAF